MLRRFINIDKIKLESISKLIKSQNKNVSRILCWRWRYIFVYGWFDDIGHLLVIRNLLQQSYLHLITCNLSMKNVRLSKCKLKGDRVCTFTQRITTINFFLPICTFFIEAGCRRIFANKLFFLVCKTSFVDKLITSSRNCLVDKVRRAYCIAYY